MIRKQFLQIWVVIKQMDNGVINLQFESLQITAYFYPTNFTLHQSFILI